MNWPDILKPKPWHERYGVPRYAQYKLDGHRLTIYVDTHIRAMTTVGHDIADKLKYWKWWLPIVKLPLGTMLDCELWIPGTPASQVKTAIKKRWPALQLTCFAIPVYDGDDARHVLVSDIADVCTVKGIDFAPWERIKTFDKAEYLQRARDTGLEGWVLKDYNYQNWFKLKTENTIDLVVTGTTDGNGKWLGCVGSLRCSVYHGRSLVEVANVGGMDDDTRLAIDEQQCIGKVVEVQYQRVDSGARLRHPRFIRWRTDKLAGACASSQDDELFKAITICQP